jgi:hypothetical protein
VTIFILGEKKIKDGRIKCSDRVWGIDNNAVFNNASKY